MNVPINLKNRLVKVFEEPQAAVLAEVIYDAYSDLVRTSDFTELKEIVRDLAVSQQRTELRMDRLAVAQERTEQRMEELASAQGRTEQRMEELASAQGRTEQRMEELASAQQRTEQRMEELASAQERTEQRVEELASAQGRTEQRMEELASAQGRTEQRVEELASAQGRTEQRVGDLAVSQRRLATAQQRTEVALQNLSRQVGGLSDRLGGDLEDIAYIVLHDVLTREFGWQVGPLERTWQTWNGEKEQVDIFGEAYDPARPEVTIWVVGEAKFNLTLREVKRFAQKAARARQHLEGEIFPVLFCYRVHPDVRLAVRQAGLRLVFSYGRLL